MLTHDHVIHDSRRRHQPNTWTITVRPTRGTVAEQRATLGTTARTGDELRT